MSIIFYNKDDGEIQYTEADAMVPTMNGGTEEEIKEVLAKDNIDYIAVDIALGLDIYNYKVNIKTKDLILKEELT